jgi:drug/metabolite transporter (DMT)-like permease
MVHRGFLVLGLFSVVANSLQNSTLLAFESHTPGSMAQHADVVRTAGVRMMGRSIIRNPRNEAAVSAIALNDQIHAVQSTKAEQHAESESKKGKEVVDIDKIFPVIFVLYATLGIFWFIWNRMPDQHDNHTAKVLLLCMSWCAMSVGMHTLNKALSVLLEAPSLIALSQMAVSVVIFGAMSWKDLRDAEQKQILIWMIVPIFFASMLISSFYTYEFISLSMLTIVRNLTPLVVLPIESMVMPAEKQPHINKTIIGSILIMLCGAIIYGGNVIDFSWIGIAFALLNMLLACSDRLIQRRLLTDQCKGLTSSACSILNNGVATIPTFGMALATQEITKVTSPELSMHWKDPHTLTLLALSGLVGMGICFFGFECQREVSATSFFVMQNLSKVAVVSVGVTVFGDSLSSPWAVVGLVMSLGGSFVYGQAQMEASSKDKGETQKLVPKDAQKPVVA